MIGGLYGSGSGYSDVGYVEGLSLVYQPFFFFGGSVVDPDNLWFLRLHAGFFCDFGGRRERYVFSVGSYLRCFAGMIFSQYSFEFFTC